MMIDDANIAFLESMIEITTCFVNSNTWNYDVSDQNTVPTDAHNVNSVLFNF